MSAETYTRFDITTLEAALAVAGRSRTGYHGQPVDVYIDGERY